MVKSPWKLLTRLLSRGKVADQRDVDQAGPSEMLDDAERPEIPRFNASEASEEVGLGPGRELSLASQAAESENVNRQESAPAIAAEASDVTPAGEVPALASDRTTGTVGAGRRNSKRRASPKIRRKTKAEVPEHNSDAETDIALPKQGGPTQANLVQALDSEISELRFRLAAKLRLQNVQLRQMLKRFEPK
ncbi:hypothetical protein [Sinorhizobium meliloti]|uniref:hypothetical protein n=1 Tax=Rhizobium meliloti TaxID=382 RepID=UPI00037BAD49|nr:hypothetical protein [Sinorhizobium meliloti]